MSDNLNRYDDIIALPHPDPLRHKRMAMTDRAAQFSPFAALTGYDDIIREEARLTGRQEDLDEQQLEALDKCMRDIRENLSGRPEAVVTWFRKDARKNGGSYECKRGNIKNIDEASRLLVFTDGVSIPLGDIHHIDLVH